VANMSHELRTPLNAVIGYSQMLLEEAADEPDDGSAEDLNKIHGAGQHLLNLVNEVLDLAKIEAGKMEIVPEEIAVADFLSNLCSPHAATAQAKGVPLKLQMAADLGAAKWDGQRVSQALDQILSNAVKFTSEGSVNVTVSRHPARPAHRIQIQIRDTGIGIAPEMLPRLFETFTVAHDSTASKYGDTGLGLSLSLALCRLMGGQIEATSTLGAGSCFIISLPVAPVSPRRARKASPKAEIDYDVPLTSAA
jgi:signal transduction histidine kinase